MKTLLAFYSFTGTTKAICDKLRKNSLAVYEITEVKKRNKFTAYLLGSFSALRKKPSKINPISIKTSNYDLILIASPIWAGSLAPAAMAFIQQANLKGKKVIIVGVSASGKDCSANARAVLKSVGAECVNVYNTTKKSTLQIKELQR